MNRVQAPEPDDPVALGKRLVEALDGANLIARGEQVAGVQAHAEALVAACRIDQCRQFLERAPKRAPGAGGVLEMQRAALRFGQGLPDPLAEPGCSTTPVAPIASPTRSECVSDVNDFSRISGSSEAQLSRYTAWISTA